MPPGFWPARDPTTIGASKSRLRESASIPGRPLDLIDHDHFRPSIPDAVPAAERARFPALPMVTVDDAFGGWKKAQADHFADGGFFDRIIQAGR